ncbi:hypothetical protein [Microlunatus parietis]|uniref:Uncharacterized protein n=1 Tax=Microlunatus parietis TaxID=682979 RepID=A0A7Y9L9E9_9ACTN|nr:hypothetical protein [Microlunatus parietis]NYE71714.1 hypothetical protein [Microlunatus parietis]
MEPVSLRVPLAAPITAACVSYPTAPPILSVWTSRYFLTFLAGTRTVTPLDVEAVRHLANVMREFADELQQHMEREDDSMINIGGAA